MKPASLAIALILAAAPAFADPATVPTSQAQTAADPDAEILAGRRPLPGLRFYLTTDAAKFEQGAPIPITLHYQYKPAEKEKTRQLSVTLVTYDRGGRIRDFHFQAIDSPNARDPLDFSDIYIGGGLRGGDKLAPDHPYKQTVFLNEWLAFDKPGKYRIKASSGIVHLGPGTYDHPAIPLESEPLEIEITPPDEQSRAKRIAALEKTLKDDRDDARVQAMQELRFMIDPRAIPAMVAGLEDPSSNIIVHARFGLQSFKDLAPVKAELLKRLDSPKILSPRHFWEFEYLLARADLQGKAPQAAALGVDFKEARSKWHQKLEASFLERVKKLPEAEQAPYMLQALNFGPAVSRDNPAPLRLVLENIHKLTPEQQDHAQYAVEPCRIKELAPALQQVVKDDKLPGGLRSAAVVALHEMGDNSPRDAVAADAAATRPALTDKAYKTLGDYKAREIGTSLVKHLSDPDYAVRESAARRLPAFATEVPEQDLAEAAKLTETDNAYVRTPVVAALVQKSPEKALPFLERIIRDPKLVQNHVRTQAIYLLATIDSPAARELVLEVLHSKEATDRSEMARVLGQTFESAASEKKEAKVPPSFVPELIELFEKDESEQVRVAARDALSRITKIPPMNVSMQTETALREKILPAWKNWSKENKTEAGLQKE